MRRLSLLRTVGITVATVFAILLMAPMTSFASSEGRRNTAIGLSLGAIYSAVRGNNTAAIVLGAGAGYAWGRQADSNRNYPRYYQNYGYGNYYYGTRYPGYSYYGYGTPGYYYYRR